MKWFSIFWALLWAGVCVFWVWMLKVMVAGVTAPEGAALLFGFIWGVLFAIFFRNFWQATGDTSADWRESGE